MTLSRQEVRPRMTAAPFVFKDAFFERFTCCMFYFLIFIQVIRRLRERGEPIRLFGESDYDAFQRLRKIEILTPEVNKVKEKILKKLVVILMI